MVCLGYGFALMNFGDHQRAVEFLETARYQGIFPRLFCDNLRLGSFASLCWFCSRRKSYAQSWLHARRAPTTGASPKQRAIRRRRPLQATCWRRCARACAGLG